MLLTRSKLILFLYYLVKHLTKKCSAYITSLAALNLQHKPKIPQMVYRQ